MTTSTDDLLVDVSEPAVRLTPPPVGDGSREGVAGEPAEAAQPAAEAPAADNPEYEPQEFDPRHQQPFMGLMYLGALTEEFTLFGHRFRIATPSQLERLEIGRVHAPYADTLSSEIAFETAMVAAYLSQIDGQDLPMPVLNNPKDSALQDRYNWVVENIRRPVMNKIYNKCLALEQQVDEVLDAMGEA